MCKPFKIITSNVRGITQIKNRAEKLNKLAALNPDILFVQELRLNHVDQIKEVEEFWKLGTVIISIGTDTADGVGIFFNSKDIEIIKRRDIIPGRLLVVDCKIKGNKFRLINVYTAPDRSKKVQLFKKLPEILCGGQSTILAGDFNTVTDSKDREASTTFKLSREGGVLKEICENFELIDVFRSLYPDKFGFTRYDQKTKTRIDRIYVSKQNKIKTYQTDAFINSDHLVVTCKITCVETKTLNQWKLNTTWLKNEHFIKVIKEEIDRVKSLECIVKSQNELWSILKNRLKKVMISESKHQNQERNKIYDEKTLKYVDLKRKSNKTVEEEIMLEDLNKELLEYNCDFQNNLKILAGYDDMKSGTTNISNLIKKLKKRQDLKCIKGVRTDEGNIVYEEVEKQNEIVRQFKKMYAELPIDKNLLKDFLTNVNINDEITTDHIVGEIKKEEVDLAITQLNKGKTPGPDGFPAEFYISFHKELSGLMSSVFNEGIEFNNMYQEFYEGTIKLLYKKGDENEINNWRQVTLMNIEYKILAKVLMNRLETTLDKIINTEQTCAIKGRNMWDNLCTIRELVSKKELNNSGFYILAMDQKKAFDTISREYLWAVLKEYNFPENYINMVKLLYAKSMVKISVNGNLTEKIDIFRGVKQGCPLSAALYVLAINPLLTTLKKEESLTGVILNPKVPRCVVSAFADDVTVFIKNQDELNKVYEYFNMYEKVSGASLNHTKTEAIWIGNEKDKNFINIELKNEIKILGIFIDNDNCAENNWNKKIEEAIDETNKFQNWNVSYREKVELIKILVLSKLMFLSIVFPPNEMIITKLNKLCIKTIWGNNREVTKRSFVYKSKENGGLGAFEIGDKLKISYCKHVKECIEKDSKWIGNKTDWEKIKGIKRKKIPYYKLIYSDFIEKYKFLNLDWKTQSSKLLYKKMADFKYGEKIKFHNCSDTENENLIDLLNQKMLPGKHRDRLWLSALGRLPVRGVVKWSCNIKTTACPMPNCMATETVGHLLIDCYRSREVWDTFKKYGLDIDLTREHIIYGTFNLDKTCKKRIAYWICICIIINQIWVTRCKMTTENSFIASDKVIKQCIVKLKQRQKYYRQKKINILWDFLNCL